MKRWSSAKCQKIIRYLQMFCENRNPKNRTFAAKFIERDILMKLKEKSYFVQLVVLALFTLGGMLVFSSLGTLLVMLLYHTPNILEAADPVTAIRITQTLTTIGTFLVPSLLFAYCYNRQWFDYNAANRQPRQSMVNMVLILSVTLLPVVGVLAAFNESIMPQEGAVAEFMRDMEETANHILGLVTSQRSSWDLIANILVFAVLAGICEEFFFQGTLQPLLTSWTRSPHIGILLTALIFSALHFQFYGFIPRFLLGLYLGYLLYWSKSLWLPILAHVLHNALSILVDFTLQGRGIDTDNMHFTDMKGSLPTAAACALISAMAIVYIWRIYRDGEHTNTL